MSRIPNTSTASDAGMKILCAIQAEWPLNCFSSSWSPVFWARTISIWTKKPEPSQMTAVVMCRKRSTS